MDPERVFSSARYLCSKVRSSLLDETLNDLICTSFCHIFSLTREVFEVRLIFRDTYHLVPYIGLRYEKLHNIISADSKVTELFEIKGGCKKFQRDPLRH